MTKQPERYAYLHIQTNRNTRTGSRRERIQNDARTHARTHARTREHTHTHTHTQVPIEVTKQVPVYVRADVTDVDEFNRKKVGAHAMRARM